jgi:transcriptional regulator of acetoin/glycerol metabolism
MPDTYDEHLQMLTDKIVNDLNYVAPEAQVEWLRMKLPLFANAMNARLQHAHDDLERALAQTRKDLSRAGGVPPEATALPFFKAFDVTRLLRWARRSTYMEARRLPPLCIVGPPASGKNALARALRTVFEADTADGISVVDEAQEALNARDFIYLANKPIPCAKNTDIVTLTATSAVELAKLGHHVCGDPAPIIARDLEWLLSVRNA